MWVYLGLAHSANDAARQSLDPVLRFAGRRLGHQLHDLVGFGIAGRLSQRDQLTDPERVRHDGAPARRRKLPVSGRLRIGSQGAPLSTSDQALFRLAADSLPVRRRLRRESVIKFAASLPSCIVAMEACCGAHHLGRILRSQGHEVRLMSPEYVRPYVKAQKNDDRDAEAIAEAATRPTMRFVELKSEAQLDMQSLHRARDRLVGERTALINQLRAVLLERGIVVPQGRRKLEQHLAAMLDEGEGLPLSPRVRALVEDMRAEWRELDRRIGAFDDEFAARAQHR